MFQGCGEKCALWAQGRNLESEESAVFSWSSPSHMHFLLRSFRCLILQFSPFNSISISHFTFFQIPYVNTETRKVWVESNMDIRPDNKWYFCSKEMPKFWEVCSFVFRHIPYISMSLNRDSFYQVSSLWLCTKEYVGVVYKVLLVCFV